MKYEMMKFDIVFLSLSHSLTTKSLKNIFACLHIEVVENINSITYSLLVVSMSAESLALRNVVYEKSFAAAHCGVRVVRVCSCAFHWVKVNTLHGDLFKWKNHVFFLPRMSLSFEILLTLALWSSGLCAPFKLNLNFFCFT